MMQEVALEANGNGNTREDSNYLSARGVVTSNLVVSIIFALLTLFVLVLFVVLFFEMRGDPDEYARFYYALFDGSQSQIYSAVAAYTDASYERAVADGSMLFIILSCFVIWEFILSIVVVACAMMSFSAIRDTPDVLSLKRCSKAGLVFSVLCLSIVQAILFSISISKANSIMGSTEKTSSDLFLDGVAVSGSYKGDVSVHIEDIGSAELQRECFAAFINGHEKPSSESRKKVKRFLSGMESQIDFNVCAFFLGPIYWAYRKCYIESIVLLAAFLAMTFINYLLGFRFFRFLPALLSAILFFKFYRSRALKVMKSGVEDGCSTRAQLIAYARDRGGVSMWGAAILLLASICAIVFYLVVALYLSGEFVHVQHLWSN